MRRFGIIGRPLGHSMSKAYFDKKFTAEGFGDCRFDKFQLERIGELDSVIARYGDELQGFCVTIPYKKDIVGRLDEISDEARTIGAVNCVRVKDGKLTGYNTDALGFRVALERFLGAERSRALVLGTGGASCAVRWVLENMGIEYRMVSRTGGTGLMTYDELTPNIIEANKLIVNTTPLGTFPSVDGKPRLPYDAIGVGHYLFDLVYNPPVTAFMAEGEKRGARTMNGETMFLAQAEQNWRIWNA